MEEIFRQVTNAAFMLDFNNRIKVNEKLGSGFNYLAEFLEIQQSKSNLSAALRRSVAYRYLAILSKCKTHVVKYDIDSFDFSEYQDTLRTFVGDDMDRYQASKFIPFEDWMLKLCLPMQLITKSGNYFTGWVYPDKIKNNPNNPFPMSENVEPVDTESGTYFKHQADPTSIVRIAGYEAEQIAYARILLDKHLLNSFPHVHIGKIPDCEDSWSQLLVVMGAEGLRGDTTLVIRRHARKWLNIL